MPLHLQGGAAAAREAESFGPPGGAITYPESWAVVLEGGGEQYLMLAEGRCEGSISGRFRGANFPHRRTPTGPFRPDFRAVIDTDDGATIMFE